MNQKIQEGEVWFAEFPLEEDETQFTVRPVIVLDVDNICVLSVKVIKHEPRDSDKYDTIILRWKESGLRMKSTARISKTINLSSDDFIVKLGNLHPDDLETVTNMYIQYIKEQK